MIQALERKNIILLLRSLEDKMTECKNRTRIIMILGLCLLFLTIGCVPPPPPGGEVEKEPPRQYGPPHKKGPPPWAPAHGYRAKYQYRYYPSASVYFDIGRKLYFYLHLGEWRVSTTLPTRIRIDVGEYVILEMDTDRPFLFHTEVVKRYPPGHPKQKHKGKGKEKWK
jgi:hypothetical protein